MVEDWFSCYKIEGLYLIAKMAMACASELQSDKKCTSLIYYGPPACGKTARQEAIAAAYGLPLESILAGFVPVCLFFLV